MLNKLFKQKKAIETYNKLRYKLHSLYEAKSKKIDNYSEFLDKTIQEIKSLYNKNKKEFLAALYIEPGEKITCINYIFYLAEKFKTINPKENFELTKYVIDELLPFIMELSRKKQRKALTSTTKHFIITAFTSKNKDLIKLAIDIICLKNDNNKFILKHDDLKEILLLHARIFSSYTYHKPRNNFLTLSFASNDLEIVKMGKDLLFKEYKPNQHILQMRHKQTLASQCLDGKENFITLAFKSKNLEIIKIAKLIFRRIYTVRQNNEQITTRKTRDIIGNADPGCLFTSKANRRFLSYAIQSNNSEIYDIAIELMNKYFLRFYVPSLSSMGEKYYCMESVLSRSDKLNILLSLNENNENCLLEMFATYNENIIKKIQTDILVGTGLSVKELRAVCSTISTDNFSFLKYAINSENERIVSIALNLCFTTFPHRKNISFVKNLYQKIFKRSALQENANKRINLLDLEAWFKIVSTLTPFYIYKKDLSFLNSSADTKKRLEDIFATAKQVHERKQVADFSRTILDFHCLYSKENKRELNFSPLLYSEDILIEPKFHNLYSNERLTESKPKLLKKENKIESFLPYLKALSKEVMLFGVLPYIAPYDYDAKGDQSEKIYKHINYLTKKYPSHS